MPILIWKTITIESDNIDCKYFQAAPFIASIFTGLLPELDAFSCFDKFLRTKLSAFISHKIEANQMSSYVCIYSNIVLGQIQKGWQNSNLKGEFIEE